MSSSFNFNGDVNFTGELYRGNSLYNGLTGKMLRVDSVFGNDTQAALNPFQYPFQTINAAITNASSGNTIFLYPGTYVESITVPSGVAIRGSSTQTTAIQRSGVTSSTTLVTLSPNSRIEDVTMSLSSAINGIDLIGIQVTDTACITSKVRTCVLNVGCSASGSTNIYGVYASGTCNTGVSSSNLIRAATINVGSAGTGRVRGMFIEGSVRVATRDTNIFASTSLSPLVSNVGGCETLYPNSYLELRTSTISGTTFDISESTGSILLGSSDLVNSNANSKSFTVSISPTELLFGIIGDMANDRTYYLVPGVQPISSLSTSVPYEVPIVRNTLFFKLSITFSGTITGGDSVVFELYKNTDLTIFTLTLTAGQTSAALETDSILFTPGDEYYSRVSTIGNPGSGTFISTVLVY